MSKRTKKTAARRGRCYVCGCTESRACDGGCSWADDSCTLCSQCAKWAFRAAAGGAKLPSKFPVYGLWIVDGGPRGLGHWLIETDNGDNAYPAVYFERPLALAAAKAQRDEGLDVYVVELRASDRSMR